MCFLLAPSCCLPSCGFPWENSPGNFGSHQTGAKPRRSMCAKISLIGGGFANYLQEQEDKREKAKVANLLAEIAGRKAQVNCDYSNSSKFHKQGVGLAMPTLAVRYPIDIVGEHWLRVEIQFFFGAKKKRWNFKRQKAQCFGSWT